jgi:hypothetical protein
MAYPLCACSWPPLPLFVTDVPYSSLNPAFWSFSCNSWSPFCHQRAALYKEEEKGKRNSFGCF